MREPHVQNWIVETRKRPFMAREIDLAFCSLRT